MKCPYCHEDGSVQEGTIGNYYWFCPFCESKYPMMDIEIIFDPYELDRLNHENPVLQLSNDNRCMWIPLTRGQLTDVKRFLYSGSGEK